MKRNQTGKPTQQNDRMLTEKTNQDFNKQKPNPNDPNQSKNHQTGNDEGGENQLNKGSDESEERPV